MENRGDVFVVLLGLMVAIVVVWLIYPLPNLVAGTLLSMPLYCLIRLWPLRSRVSSAYAERLRMMYKAQRKEG